MKNFYIMSILLLVFSLNSQAASVMSYTDRGTWTADLAGSVISTEDFNGDDLYMGTFSSGGFLPGLTMSGEVEICNSSTVGCLYDINELVGLVTTGSTGASNITINFGSDIFSFGGDWDLPMNNEGSGFKVHDGAGRLLLTLGGDSLGFFGVISDFSFSSIILSAIPSSSGGENSEIFSLDNLSFASPAAVPVPAAIWLFGSGFIGLLASRRKTTAKNIS